VLRLFLQYSLERTQCIEKTVDEFAGLFGLVVKMNTHVLLRQFAERQNNSNENAVPITAVAIRHVHVRIARITQETQTLNFETVLGPICVTRIRGQFVVKFTCEDGMVSSLIEFIFEFPKFDSVCEFRISLIESFVN
jgi:hypothetical protein